MSTPSGIAKALSWISIVSGPPLQTGPRSGSVKLRTTDTGPFTGTSSEGAQFAGKGWPESRPSAEAGISRACQT